MKTHDNVTNEGANINNEELSEFALTKEAGITRDYSAVLPSGHNIARGPLVFMTDMTQKMEKLI